MIPVTIKTRNRPALLAFTIRGALAGMPENAPLDIIDDGSDDPQQHKLLDGDRLNAPLAWPDDEDWAAACQHPPERKTCSLPANDSRLSIYRHQRLGVLAGHLHYARHAAERHPQAPWLIMLEDDLAFTEDWYAATAALLDQQLDDVGYVSFYDRHEGLCPRAERQARLHPPQELIEEVRSPRRRNRTRRKLGIRTRQRLTQRQQKALAPQLDEWLADQREANLARGWRDIPRDDSDTHHLAGGPAYAIRPHLTQADVFTADYPPDATGGDAAIQQAIQRQGYSTLTLCPSMVQHLGVVSHAHPGRHLRYTQHLTAPLVYP